MKHKNRFRRAFSLVLALMLLVTSVGYSVLIACSRDTTVDESSGMSSEGYTESVDIGSAESESESTEDTQESTTADETAAVIEDESYTSRDDVALYINTYNHLPYNFITKSEAKKLGWEGGSLEPYAPGCCIGGDTFGNYEGLLPKKDGRTYTECDIDTLGADSRGAKRIVFSNDGLIYYTDDHYESFELLYGEE